MKYINLTYIQNLFHCETREEMEKLPYMYVTTPDGEKHAISVSQAEELGIIGPMERRDILDLQKMKACSMK